MLRQYLTEHVVINTEAVDAWASQWMRRFSTEEARAWIYKRIRSWLLNDETLLVKLQAHDIPPNAPGFVRSAVDRGEQVYRWEPIEGDAHEVVVERLSHILDFVLSVEAMIGMVPTNPIQQEQVSQAKKIISKLSKMTIEQAEQMAEQWAKLAGAGLKKGQKKEGVIVLHTWENGMYAVRYTDQKVMQRDGHDLQNCLRQGTYWSQVTNGTQWVVSIRKPNDEAVVGMRWSIPEPFAVLECKGKQNLPVGREYVPYVIDLLKAMRVSGNNNPDLRAAGIEYHDGKFGTFRDIADHFTFGSLQIWRSTSAFEAEIAGQLRVVTGRMSGNYEVASLSIPEEFKDSSTIQILNGLGRIRVTFSDHVLANLVNEHGIFRGEGGFGTAENVGKSLGEYPSDGGYGPAKFFSTLGPDKTGYMVMINNDESYLAYVKEGKLRTLNSTIEDMVDAADIIEAMNRGKIGAEYAMENSYMHRWGYVHTPKGWKPIEEAGKPMGDAGQKPLGWNYNDQIFMYKTEKSFEVLRLNKGTLNSMRTFIAPTKAEKDLANLIVRTFKVKTFEGINEGECGVIKTGTGGLIATPDVLAQLLEAYSAGPMNNGDIYDMRRTLSGPLLGAAYHHNLEAALENGSFVNMPLAQATRIFNVLNPMKLKEPVLFKASKTRAAHGQQYIDVYTFVPESLAMFETLWKKHPKLHERYLKIIEALNEYGLKGIEQRGGSHFMLSSSGHGSMRSDYRIGLTPLFKKIVDIASECRRSLENAARNPPENASVTSRYQAINTLRDLRK